MVCGASVSVSPASCDATVVPRQNRSLPCAAGTLRVRSSLFDMYAVPVSAFSGWPPLAGGLNRGSRQVPVHSALGSLLVLSQVSL
jgi:hypothetical protein